METVRIKTPITVLHEGVYKAPGTLIELPIDEAERMTERFGAWEDSKNMTMSDADIASIETLNRMRRITMTKNKPASIDDQLAAARADLKVQQNALATIAADENSSLWSDEAYVGWTRRKRIAETEYQRLSALVDRLETQVDDERRAEELAVFDDRYTRALERADRLETMYREDLPHAWKLIEGILRESASLEMEAERLHRQMPDNYQPKRSVYNPD